MPDSKPHILVVDDEPDIRNILQDILQDEGYEISLAENAEQARIRFRDKQPDLVLLDIWMPDIDGISLLKEWSVTGSLDSEVVIMSGHGTLETAVEATRLGAFDFVQKPLSLKSMQCSHTFLCLSGFLLQHSSLKHGIKMKLFFLSLNENNN